MSHGAPSPSTDRLVEPIWGSSQIDGWLYANRVTTAAFASSVITTVAAYPLDSIKSRLQVEKFPSYAACVRDTYRYEGIAGFFRGIGLPMVSVSAMRTIAFAVYESTKRNLRERRWLEKDTMRDTFVAGGAGGIASGLTSSIISCPLELTKIRLQLDRNIARLKDPNAPFVPKNTVNVAREMWHVAGFRGLYFGLPQHMTRDTIGSCFYFASYDTLRWSVSKFYPDELPLGLPSVFAPFTCGLTAGISSWCVTYPFDVIKSRVQRNALSGIQINASRILLDILRHSPKELYTGLGISIVRSGFSHGLTWVIVEKGSEFIVQSTRAGTRASYSL